ncbi:MAG TPA: hypothetical protein VH560_04330, partial [Polyangia bacterium]|nr:hypothetical protein [Polyangia bacterium]
MRSSIVILAVIVSVGWIKPARACSPAVRLTGDAALVAAVAPVLVERGIATADDACPAAPVDLQRRGKLIVVSTANAPATEWVVSDVRTAATIIESWVRTDVDAPLLLRRQRDDAELGAAPPGLVAWLPPPPSRDVEVFTSIERSLASDGTGWIGIDLGACLMLGPLCASAMARLGAVTEGPGLWAHELDRRAVEILLGAALPMRFGRVGLSPGLGVGVGWTHTNDDALGTDEETGGLRAEGRVALSYAFSRRLAGELALAFEVTQATHLETATPMPLPD